MRPLISAFIDREIADVQSLEAALRQELEGKSIDEKGVALRHGVSQAHLRRGSCRRELALGVLSRLLAELCMARGDFAGALTHFGVASRELAQALTAAERAKLSLDQAWVYHYLGNYPTSLDLGAEAQRTLGSEANPALEGLAHSLRGINFYRLGRLDEALGAHAAALAQRKQANDLAGQAASLNNLGNVHLDRGDWEEADRCYHESLGYYRKLKLPDREASLENNLGNLAANRGDFREAEAHHARALALRNQLGDRFGSGASRCALACAWLRAGKIPEAIEGFRRGLRLIEVSGAAELRTEGLIGLAQALMVAGETDEARQQLRQALEDARRTRNVLQQGAAHLLLARLERLAGNLSESQEALGLALNHLEHVGSRFEIARGHLETAHLQLARKQRDRARESLMLALHEFEQLGAKPERVEALALEARLATREASR
ncbi:tetratricopeptide repeat protein [bacterium]|nr:tetratricopeptide repeat protein [bacterium]